MGAVIALRSLIPYHIYQKSGPEAQRSAETSPHYLTKVTQHMKVQLFEHDIYMKALLGAAGVLPALTKDFVYRVPGPGTVVFIIGAPGAGKSFIANWIAQIPNWVLVDGDEFMQRHWRDGSFGNSYKNQSIKEASVKYFVDRGIQNPFKIAPPMFAAGDQTSPDGMAAIRLVCDAINPYWHEGKDAPDESWQPYDGEGAE